MSKIITVMVIAFLFSDSSYVLAHNNIGQEHEEVESKNFDDNLKDQDCEPNKDLKSKQDKDEEKSEKKNKKQKKDKKKNKSQKKDSKKLKKDKKKNKEPKSDKKSKKISDSE